MACSKWEEIGLLYTSGELSEKDSQDFKEHLKVCAPCRDEDEAYRYEKNAFYNVSILGGVPSEKVDREIKRVCGTYRKQFTFMNILPLFARKSMYSAAFFLLGFVAVGYIAVNMQQASSSSSSIVKNDSSAVPAPLSSVNLQETLSPDSGVSDSSVFDSAAAYSRTRGNLELNGVIPVDLKNK